MGPTHAGLSAAVGVNRASLCESVEHGFWPVVGLGELGFLSYFPQFLSFFFKLKTFHDKVSFDLSDLLKVIQTLQMQDKYTSLLLPASFLP